MTFTERVLSVTQDTLLPKAVDIVLGDNWVTFRVISNAKKWSGETLRRPLKVSKSTLGGSFSGMDVHSTNTIETRVRMAYNISGYEMPISIPGFDIAVNRTEAQVMDLVRTEVESSTDDALDDIGTMLYADGTGNSSKDFNGWDNLIDDGTTSDTVGGLSRTTYTSLKSTRTASGGTMSLSKISTLLSAVSSGSSLRQRPSVLVSNETVWDLYESLLTPTARSNYETFGLPMMSRTSRTPIRQAEMKGAAGFVALTYRGIPWIADEKSPSQTLWAPNENYSEWYGLNDPDLKSIDMGGGNIDGVYSDVPSKNIGFQWTGFMRPINQYGQVSHVYLLGQQVNWNPKRSGRLTGITGV